MVALWKEYAHEMRKQGKMSFYHTMAARNPVLEGELKMMFWVDNQVQLNDFDRERPELLAFMREQLQNYAIEFEVQLVASPQADHMRFYSPNDRFKAMIEKNPSLGELRKRFDLDLEH